MGEQAHAPTLVSNSDPFDIMAAWKRSHNSSLCSLATASLAGKKSKRGKSKITPNIQDRRNKTGCGSTKMEVRMPWFLNSLALFSSIL